MNPAGDADFDWSTTYRLREPLQRRAIRLDERGGLPLATRARIYAGMVIPEEPVHAVASEGTQLRDFLWPTAGAPVAIRERVRHLLISEALTGWATYPVALVGKDGTPIAGYVGFTVTGLCGPWLETDPTDERPLYRFDPATLDGSDFFHPPNSVQWMVNARAKAALKAANVRNIDLESLSDLRDRRIVWPPKNSE